MATSTFDKRIIIDDAAADVLIGLLNKPVPPYTDISGKFSEITEEDMECYRRARLARSSEQKKNRK
jgi:hypothetical protein